MGAVQPPRMRGVCEMALVRARGDLESLNETGKCEHRAPHTVDAVARVPDPRTITAAGIDLCPFHLALWDDIHGDVAEKAGVGDLVPENVLLHLDDLPEEREKCGHIGRRLGIDHVGRGHYLFRVDGSPSSVLVVDGELEAVVDRPLRSGVGVDDWLELVLDDVGWMLLEDEFAGFNQGDGE